MCRLSHYLPCYFKFCYGPTPPPGHGSCTYHIRTRLWSYVIATQCHVPAYILRRYASIWKPKYVLPSYRVGMWFSPLDVMYYVIPCTYIYTGRYGGPLHSSSQPSLYTVQNMSNSSGEFEPNFWGTERPNDYHNLDFVLTTPELIRKAVDDAIHEGLYLDLEYIPMGMCFT